MIGDSIMNAFYEIEKEILSIEELSEIECINFCRKIFNFNVGVQYELKYVKINEIIPLTLFVQTPRLKQAAKLKQMLIDAKLPIFSPIKVTYSNKSERRILEQIILPPILEFRGEKYFLCDGAHRIFSTKKNISKVRVLVVNSATSVLPGEPTTWDEIVETANLYKTEENFINFNPSGLTGYSRISNSEKMWVQHNVS